MANQVDATDQITLHIGDYQGAVSVPLQRHRNQQQGNRRDNAGNANGVSGFCFSQGHCRTPAGRCADNTNTAKHNKTNHEIQSLAA